MDTNDLAIIIALISTAFSTYSTVRARNTKQLGLRIDTVEVDNHRLYQWQYVARLYIADLRGRLADRGDPAPEPPPELELTFNAAAG
ncbi:hypothetical protein [Prescottella equi]